MPRSQQPTRSNRFRERRQGQHRRSQVLLSNRKLVDDAQKWLELLSEAAESSQVANGAVLGPLEISGIHSETTPAIPSIDRLKSFHHALQSDRILNQSHCRLAYLPVGESKP